MYLARMLHLLLLALTGTFAAVMVRQQPAGSARWVRTGCTDQGKVDRTFASLTDEQRVGQLFMVGLRSGDVSGQTDTAITNSHAGNVVLYGTGWSGSDVVKATTSALAEEAIEANSGVAPFISGNQEGGAQGSLQAFYGRDFDMIPSAQQQPAGKSPQTLSRLAKQWGDELLAAGISLNLAPVLDTVPPELVSTNQPIGQLGREYGSDPGMVKAFGVAFMQGMHDANVATAVKHFPGLGRVTGNTDFTADGIVDSQFSGPNDPYLDPFKAAIGDNTPTDFVMVSLADYPGVDPDEPAVFSKTIVTDILRNQLHFNGVIITDDVGAAAAVAGLSPEDRALRFFRAGGDMVLTVQPNDIALMIAATLAAMHDDPAFTNRTYASVQRVLSAKATHGLLSPIC